MMFSTRPHAFRGLLLSLLIGGTACLRAEEFETFPPLKAADVVAAPWLRSQWHSVDPEIGYEVGLIRFVVRSADGTSVVIGRELLQKRVREIVATAVLREKSTAGAAAGGLVDEGVDTGKALAGAAKQPVKTILSIPKGMVAVAKRSVGSVENQVQSGGAYTEGPVQDWFHISQGKLDIAAELGVDPYTDYEPLQKELNRLGGAAQIAGVPLRIALPGDGLIAAAQAGDLASQLHDVYTTPPSQLFQENIKLLGEAGVPKDRASVFLNGTAFSPADQSFIVRTVAAMGNPGGADLFIDAAMLIQTQQEGFLFRRSTDLLRRYHDQGVSINELTNYGGYPAAISTQHRLILPLYVDQIYWSQRAAEMADDVLAFQRTVGCEGTDLLISGQISARAMSELQKRGVHAFAVTP